MRVNYQMDLESKVPLNEYTRFLQLFHCNLQPTLVIESMN